MSDGRAYTAISKIPEEIGYSIQSLQILGATIGWVFAKPIGNALNGYQITGGLFNQTVVIAFPNTNQKVLVRQKYLGLDVFDQLRIEVDIQGELPILPEDSKVTINEYQEQYTLTKPGVVQSTSAHIHTYKDLDGNDVVTQYTVDQSIVFDYCKHDPIPEGSTWRLKVGRNFISYEAREQIIRFGLSNKISPLGDFDPCEEGRSTCGPNSACVVENDSFRCVCNPGFQAIYRDGNEVCEDINECLSGIHDCDYNAQCYNEIGSYQCVCHPSFEGDGRFCQNALTCSGVVCRENAHCVENGVAMCQCLPGFTGNNGLDCVPLTSQSCHLSNNCSPFGICSFDRETGQYSCNCLPGYEGDGYNCQQITTTTTTTTTETPVEEDSQTTVVDREVEKCLLGVCWCSQGYVKQPGTIYCVRKGTEVAVAAENTTLRQGECNCEA